LLTKSTVTTKSTIHSIEFKSMYSNSFIPNCLSKLAIRPMLMDKYWQEMQSQYKHHCI